MVFRKIISALVLAAAPVAFAQAGSNAATSCAAYSGQICAPYVNYTVLSSTASLDIPGLANLSASLEKIDPVCVDTYFRYACSFTFPKCESQSGGGDVLWMGCESTCQQVAKACGTTFALTGQTDLLPDCSKVSPITNATLQGDDNCNFITPKVQGEDAGINLGAIPSGFVLAECPAPFMRDPLAKEGTTDTLDPVLCRFGCCIPCPAQNLFFPTGWAEHGFLATDIIRTIGAVLAFIILISYLVLPDKRRHPSLLILNFSLAIFLFSMVSFFSIGNPKKLQCADDINQSEQRNNPLCAAQGAILIFASMATVMWCAALIVNLHLHTVWNSSFFANRYFLLNIICWGAPTAVMAVALGMHQVKFEFANLCLVSVDYIFDIFFYPLAAIICPAFLIHLTTFVYIAKIAVREGMESDMSQSLSTGSQIRPGAARKHKHVMTAVKIQWRALLLAIAGCGTVLFYWIFYFTQMGKLAYLHDSNDVINSWIECMLTPNNNQDSCYSVVGPHLPPFGLMIAAETLVSLIGFWLFIIFGKRSLWREWNDLIYDLRVSLGARGRMEKNGEQFFAL